MNQFDFLIIYLTCGAPLAVFYFFQNRDETNKDTLWLKTFFTFIFWIPFGFRLLKIQASKNLIFQKNNLAKNIAIESQIFQFQKYLEKLLQTSDLPISIFEFREVFDRYVGLTLNKNGENSSNVAKQELFQIADVRRPEISVVCLNRRNHQRLTFHQIQSRKDFFRIIEQFALVSPDIEKFANSTADFFRLIEDAEAVKLSAKLLINKFEVKKDFVDTELESFLWNTERHNLLQTTANQIQFQALTQTAKSTPKD